jgi:hypothetical protein
MIISVTARQIRAAQRLANTSRERLLFKTRTCRRDYSVTPPVFLAWWSPFSSRSAARDNNPRVASSAKATENPRQTQERKDLILALLATEFRRLSLMDSKTSRDEIVDQAFQSLAQKNLDEKTTLQLRHEIQSALKDQVVQLFQAFGKADASLPDTDLDDPLFESLLAEELILTAAELEDPMQSPKGPHPEYFLELKLGAVHTLLDRRKNDQDDVPAVLDSPNEKVSWAEADDFGYHETIDRERNDQVRHFQTVNICRAVKLKQELGYSVIALQSSIPGAGRGVYVDGYAKAGSILAFQPGEVWGKEHLVNLPVEVEKELEKNDRYQMSLRPDDHLIDSRKSPYTVLTGENSNPLALGHVVNHPTPSKAPNCRSVMVNFTTDMELGVAKRYIPNTYARPRALTLMGSLWEREAIDMHGMLLLATRDVCNEEIFYDYRLHTTHLPRWYHGVKDTEFLEPAVEEEKNENK